MSNLLPKKNKKHIKQEYLLRLIIVLLTLSALTFVFSAMFIIPSYFLSKDGVEIAAERINSLKNYLEIKQNTDIGPAVLAINEDITVLNLELNPSLSEHIGLIIKERGRSININSFGVQKLLNGETAIIIFGEARDRDSLIDFTKQLEGLSQFASVELPVSNLAGNIDVNFSINLTISKSSL